MSSADNDGLALLEGFPDPVIRYEKTDEGRIVQWANDRATALFGSVAAEGQPLTATIESFEVLTETEPLVGPEGEVVAEYETAAATKTFRIRWASDGTNEPATGVVVFTDVTAAVAKGRDDQTDAPSDPTVEQVVHVLSHDLRNPLEVAELRLEAARETGEAVHFEKVTLALDRIEALIEDLRTIAKGDVIVTSTAPVALEEVARNAWSTVQTGPASLEVDGAVTIEADEDRLRQALENAFRNSVEHAGEGVTVRVGPISDGDGFYVADDGPGIPSDRRDTVFEPGVSAREGGTGLGLTIIDRIATAHGWSITIADAADGGLRLEFREGTVHD
ncbi:sensor histidine kinase [Natronococcus pandeyae]|uniref:histidine kinase n=1 Tax=Natronococcus pandeyae TaxID=2055836 RepID=A0A8J8PZ98_9EURY|nr:HAMP domain-containing sensor histidine kinase [Natronococcus pandeyae]TYL36392.1 sensor histidine kinase [Natronococcus pandeyae]